MSSPSIDRNSTVSVPISSMNRHRTRQEQSSPAHLWWMNPTHLYLFFIVPAYLGTIGFLNGAHSGAISSQVRISSEIDYTTSTVGLLCLLSFALGSSLLRAPNSLPPSNIIIDDRILTLLFVGTMFGYCAWFYGAWKNVGVGVALKALMGDGSSVSRIRTSGELLAGISSLTQLGPVFCIAFVVSDKSQMKWKRRFQWAFITIVAFALVRTITWAERLAALEIAVPTAIAALMTMKQYPRFPGSKALLQMGPYAGLLLVVLVFGLAEAGRSWRAYSAAYSGNILQFTTDRIALYYSLAVNNGAAVLSTIDKKYEGLPFSLDWFYKLPLISGSSISAPLSSFSYSYQTMLKNRLDPEFTNMSGLYAYIFDYGLILAPFVFFLFGALVKYVYVNAIKSGIFSRLLYPIIMLASFELLRIPYLTSSRAFIIIFGCALVWFLSRQRAPRYSNRFAASAANK